MRSCAKPEIDLLNPTIHAILEIRGDTNVSSIEFCID